MLNSVMVEPRNVIQDNYEIEMYQLKCRTYHFLSPSITEHSPMSDSIDESTSPDTIILPIENQESTSINQSQQT